MCRYLKRLNKKIAYLLRRPKFIVLIILILSLLLCLFFPDKAIGDFKITSSSLFSGLLALNGFMFTSRTFIVFKLYETVYSKEKYRDRIDKLRKNGAYNKELLAPLRSLDSSLSLTAILSLLSLVLLVLISFIGSKPDIFDRVNVFNIVLLVPVDKIFFPIFYKILSDIVCSVMIVTFVELFYSIRSLNMNFKRIFDVWRDEEEISKLN